ncbi:STAS domain-containing protein [Candidatus Paracaedibacter symbiosus]|uniref:STAS domain-containing protein n=1 Tax=Candidatus Paracaedibacter symbiosus TaxID=244582 RepID=UPI00069117A7|nr:STAS domain-containing protein [Candidatus Paracaedibacter symbiosus]
MIKIRMIKFHLIEGIVDYTIKAAGEEIQVDLKGRLTFADYGAFKELTELFIEHNPRNCLLDLSNLEFIDSAGLGMLLIARDKNAHERWKCDFKRSARTG